MPSSAPWRLSVVGSLRLPEDVEDLVVGDFRGVEDDLRGFGVAGGFGADLFVSGMVGGAAGKTAGHGNDAGDPFEHRFHAPKTTSAQVGGLGFWHRAVQFCWSHS